MTNWKRPSTVLALFSASLFACALGCGGSGGAPPGSGGARGTGGAGSGGVRGSGGAGATGSGGSGGATPAGIPEGMACGEAAAAFCQKIFGCQDTASALVRAFLKSEAACEATVVQNCGAAGFQCGAGATYHGDQAQACTNGFTSESCQTIGSSIAAGLTSASSIATVLAHLGATIPACSGICSGGTDGGAG